MFFLLQKIQTTDEFKSYCGNCGFHHHTGEQQNLWWQVFHVSGGFILLDIKEASRVRNHGGSEVFNYFIKYILKLFVDYTNFQLVVLSSIHLHILTQFLIQQFIQKLWACKIEGLQRGGFCSDGADFLKVLFLCGQKKILNVLGKQNRAKYPQKITKNTEKRKNSDKWCIFAFNNPNFVKSLKNVARPYGRTF